jgi:hypothetical protein
MPLQAERLLLPDLDARPDQRVKVGIEADGRERRELQPLRAGHPGAHVPADRVLVPARRPAALLWLVDPDGSDLGPERSGEERLQLAWESMAERAAGDPPARPPARPPVVGQDEWAERPGRARRAWRMRERAAPRPACPDG